MAATVVVVARAVPVEQVAEEPEEEAHQTYEQLREAPQRLLPRVWWLPAVVVADPGTVAPALAVQAEVLPAIWEPALVVQVPPTTAQVEHRPQEVLLQQAAGQPELMA